jgi:hypothetical protein
MKSTVFTLLTSEIVKGANASPFAESNLPMNSFMQLEKHHHHHASPKTQKPKLSKEAIESVFTHNKAESNEGVRRVPTASTQNQRESDNQYSSKPVAKNSNYGDQS